ncbi:MAG TPA: hypothetical protein VK012_05560 [Gemmatimonadales bacterium]|nr:hypothetical protein [Gemmatimonadales bacterium]
MRRRQHPVRRLVTSVAILPVFFMLLYYAWLATTAWRLGYSWPQMDWNDDGRTTIREFLSSVDVGRRPVTFRGRTCTEYFRLEDARPLRVDCDAPQ